MKSTDELKAVCLGAILSCSLSTVVVALTVVVVLLLAGCVTGAGYNGAAPGCEFQAP